MTPKKGTLKNRDATVVYPGTSPELMLAYRIFGPGCEDLEELAKARKSIVKSHPPEPGESWLTPLGQDIERDLDVSVGRILLAYGTYVKEIERMNKVDRIHKRRKQAQLDGVNAEEDAGDGDDSDDVEEVDSNGNSNSNSNSDKGDEEVEDCDDEDEDPLAQFYKKPELWLSKEEALSKTRSLKASIAQMNATLSNIIGACDKNLHPCKELTQAIESSGYNFCKVSAYADCLEHMVKLHDNKTPESTWKSRDQINVTFGDKVPWTLHRFYELQDRIEEMRAALAICKRIRDKLPSTRLLTERMKLQEELMFNLRMFAAMCWVEEFRADYLNELEEERKQWEKTEPSTFWPNKRRKIGSQGDSVAVPAVHFS